MNVNGATAGGVERVEVPDGLRELQRPKREWLARNVDVGRRRVADEDEDAVVRATLVQLPCRMQVARAIAEHGGRTRLLPHLETELRSELREGFVGTEIGEHANVVAGLDKREQR